MLRFTIRLSLVFLIALLFESSCVNKELHGVTLRIDTSMLTSTDFSDQFVSDLKSRFISKGLIVSDSTNSQYTLIISSTEDYATEGDEVKVYERCFDCTTGDEISYSESTEILYSDGYSISCKLVVQNSIELLNTTISDESSDKLKSYSKNSCSNGLLNKSDFEGEQVKRGVFSGLNPSNKVSRIVLRAMRRNE